MPWYDLSASNQAAQNAIENRSRQQELFDQRAQYISNAFQQGGAGLQTLANTPNDIKQQKDADDFTNYLKKALNINPNAKAGENANTTQTNAGVSPLESLANETPQGNTTQDKFDTMPDWTQLKPTYQEMLQPKKQSLFSDYSQESPYSHLIDSISPFNKFVNQKGMLSALNLYNKGQQW